MNGHRPQSAGGQSGDRAVSTIEIANREYASRTAIAWRPEGYDGKTHYAAVIAAVVPAVGILAVAATLLLSIV